MPTNLQYTAFIKPFWSPPGWMFGPVWTVLYVLIAASFGKVFVLAWQRQVSVWVVVPLALNLFFNFIFTYIQFGLKNNLLASVDILLVLGTLVWSMAAVYTASLHLSIERGVDIRWVLYCMVPYFLWVAFASVLQISITHLNNV